MGNTESTVRRVTFKKDYNDDYYIDDLIMTESLAKEYFGDDKNLEPILQKKETETESQSQSKLVEEISIDNDINENTTNSNAENQQNDLNENISTILEIVKKESENKLNLIDKKNYNIDNPLKIEEEILMDCIKKNIKTPLKCQSLVDEFVKKADILGINIEKKVNL